MGGMALGLLNKLFLQDRPVKRLVLKSRMRLPSLIELLTMRALIITMNIFVILASLIPVLLLRLVCVSLVTNWSTLHKTLVVGLRD